MSEWSKRVRRNGGADGGWREDFPLNPEMPDRLIIDCTDLEPPVYPLFWLRLRTFLDWHHDQGRALEVLSPADTVARQALVEMGVLDPSYIDSAEGATATCDVSVLPVTRVTDVRIVEEIAEDVRRILEYQHTDVSSLGPAAFMAVSELCGNAVEHGRNRSGSYVAVQRLTQPRLQVAIAISDLGIGIPEHIRQRYPEWTDDDFAIAHAMDAHVSGTGHPHRGNGFSETFEAALVSVGSAARLDIHSANGFVRVHIVQGDRKIETFPAAAFKRGTWISYQLVPAAG